MSVDLDAVFGPCLPAGRSIEPLELLHEPNSLQKLEGPALEGLQSYFTSADHLKVPRVLHEKMVILWIMDEAGDIYIAFEEIVDASHGEYLMPYFRTNPVTELLDAQIKAGTIGRLGHPSLLSEDRARIGGEIRFRPNDGSSTLWKINRNSGRYGNRPHQTDKHLAAVHSLLTGKGLHIGIE